MSLGVSEGGLHPKTNAYSPVSSQLEAGREPAGGPADPVDDDRVRGLAGLGGSRPDYARRHPLYVPAERGKACRRLGLSLSLQPYWQE